MMKVILAGSRWITRETPMTEAIVASGFLISEVVSGGASGADALGEAWASQYRIPVTRFPADWSTYGKAAGPLRNRQMAAYADALIAIWDGHSRGTADMIRAARTAGLPIYLHRVGAREG